MCIYFLFIGVCEYTRSLFKLLQTTRETAIKMKDFQSKLCMLLLEEYFGNIVQCIGNSLLHSRKTLDVIRLHTNLPLIKVQ